MPAIRIEAASASDVVYRDRKVESADGGCTPGADLDEAAAGANGDVILLWTLRKLSYAAGNGGDPIDAIGAGMGGGGTSDIQL